MGRHHVTMGRHHVTMGRRRVTEAPGAQRTALEVCSFVAREFLAQSFCQRFGYKVVKRLLSKRNCIRIAKNLQKHYRSALKTSKHTSKRPTYCQCVVAALRPQVTAVPAPAEAGSGSIRTTAGKEAAKKVLPLPAVARVSEGRRMCVRIGQPDYSRCQSDIENVVQGCQVFWW